MIRFQGIEWRKNSKQLIITLPYLVKNVLQEESCADLPTKVKRVYCMGKETEFLK